MPSRRETPNVLAGAYIERAAHHRKDSAWLAQALNDPHSLYVPLWRARSLITRTSITQHGMTALLIERRDEYSSRWNVTANAAPPSRTVSRRACFALGLDEAQSPAALACDLRTTNLLGSLIARSACWRMPARLNLRERIVSVQCGAPTQPIMVVTPACRRNLSAPKLSRARPAIIVL